MKQDKHVKTNTKVNQNLPNQFDLRSGINWISGVYTGG